MFPYALGLFVIHHSTQGSYSRASVVWPGPCTSCLLNMERFCIQFEAERRKKTLSVMQCGERSNPIWWSSTHRQLTIWEVIWNTDISLALESQEIAQTYLLVFLLLSVSSWPQSPRIIINDISKDNFFCSYINTKLNLKKNTHNETLDKAILFLLLKYVPV